MQSEFDPAFVRSRVDAFFDEHFAWLEARLSGLGFRVRGRGICYRKLCMRFGEASEVLHVAASFIPLSFSF